MTLQTSLKVETTIGHNKIKFHRILLVCEKFVGSAFFELILVFYSRDLMREV